MQISWGKNKVCTCKKISVPQRFFSTPRWPLFHCFGTLILATMGSHEEDLHVFLGKGDIVWCELFKTLSLPPNTGIALPKDANCYLDWWLEKHGSDYCGMFITSAVIDCFPCLTTSMQNVIYDEKRSFGVFNFSETKETVFLFAPLIFGSFCFQVSPSICGVHQDWGSWSARILLWSFGEPNCT